MRLIGEQGGIEKFLFLYRRCPTPSHRSKQATRGPVARADRRLQIAQGTATQALLQMLQHGLTQTLPTGALMHGYLPYKEHIGTVGKKIGRDETVYLFPVLRHNAGLGKVLAEQQIEIFRIQIQWRTIGNQLMDGRGVAQ